MQSKPDRNRILSRISDRNRIYPDIRLVPSPIVKRRARISARQLHLTAYLVLQISMTSRDYLFIIFH